MTKTTRDEEAVKGGVRTAVAADSFLFFATLAFGLAMLTLLGVLALVGVVGAAHILPLLALPPALFIASGVLLWQWMSASRERSD